MTTAAPPVLDVHTPLSSYAVVFSNSDDTLQILFDKISKKAHAEFKGRRVKAGWVKYSWNDAIWNLDDDSDYTIFVWRQKSLAPGDSTPALHVRNPEEPLPSANEYRNTSYYTFKTQPGQPRRRSQSRTQTQGSVRSGKTQKAREEPPDLRKAFERFHSENGVRTIMGTIGPVENVRMLLRSGYRHVYISRKFALKHGFIPADATPGHYGYGGLVNIGTWPVTVGQTKTMHTVYLSEESHFDVVLGRSFTEKRQIKMDPVDPTDVRCMDTGEKIDCELVILKDGKGQIVTVT
ncbi:hypothetical protein EUX98_g8475 [Antrodiella citrinella]|uniref:Uncharacterized protein n=1 Tax=Antrodiella citrinella TaxID=2447956 RepID=A0A4S4M8Q6_9APHY|nr:hypothetical protein EUX98_g8475 [Antrodiella citrinella]